MDEPTPPAEDLVEFGDERILAIDFTEGGAPIGLTEREFREMEARIAGSAPWALAKSILREVAHASGVPDARDAVGYVQFLGRGLSHDVYGASTLGFAMIDQAGRVVERIRTDSILGVGFDIARPPEECAWPRFSDFPSGGLQCYARALSAGRSALGGVITRRTGGERASSAVVHRLESGVVIVEERGYEGFRRRVLLPGVSPEEAARWRLQLFPDRPSKPGCGEIWTSGAVPGGAFIEQHAGC